MTTDGDHAMIIGTIVTRFLADGTIIPGDGCDTAPASVAIELSRKVGAGACVETCVTRVEADDEDDE